MRLRRGYSWREKAGPLSIIGVDTGGGPIKLDGEILIYSTYSQLKEKVSVSLLEDVLREEKEYYKTQSDVGKQQIKSLKVNSLLSIYQSIDDEAIKQQIIAKVQSFVTNVNFD